MRQTDVEELEFEDIINRSYGKKVAALAFVSPPCTHLYLTSSTLLTGLV